VIVEVPYHKLHVFHGRLFNLYNINRVL